MARSRWSMAVLTPSVECEMADYTLLTDDEITAITRTALADYEKQHPLAGKRVLVLIPDGTRTAPIPHMFRLLHRELSGRVAALDFLIALGTHRPMSPEQIS